MRVSPYLLMFAAAAIIVLVGRLTGMDRVVITHGNLRISTWLAITLIVGAIAFYIGRVVGSGIV